MSNIYILNPYNSIGGGNISQISLKKSLISTNLFDNVVIFNAFSRIELLKTIFKLIIKLNKRNNDFLIIQGLFEIEYFLFDLFLWNKKKIIVIPRGAYVPAFNSKKIVNNTFLKIILWNLIIKKRIKKCLFWAPTSYLEQNRLFKVGANKNNTFIIPDYFNGNERFYDSKYSTVNKDQFNIEYLLFVGRISIEKNILFLINFFFEFNKKFKHYKLVIIGPIDDNSYFIELKKRIFELKLEDKIIFKFNCTNSELISFYKNSKSVLLPSHIESLGLIVLEAVYFKKYVFISDNVPIDLNATFLGESLKLEINLWVNRVSDFICNDNTIPNLYYRERLLNEFNLENITQSWRKSFNIFFDSK
jgi:glycosyltransferase involved in cell wall biosynthesis